MDIYNQKVTNTGHELLKGVVGKGECFAALFHVKQSLLHEKCAKRVLLTIDVQVSLDKSG